MIRFTVVHLNTSQVVLLTLINTMWNLADAGSDTQAKMDTLPFEEISLNTKDEFINLYFSNSGAYLCSNTLCNIST